MNNFEASLIEVMSAHLEAVSSRLAFVQSRVSAESFVRDECALAAAIHLSGQPYHVHMEKKVDTKKVDLLIVPESEGGECFHDAYLFELKMAWPGGIAECAGGIRHDLEALGSRPRSWALALYFAFVSAPDWLPFGPRRLSFEMGLFQLIDMMGRGDPTKAGRIFSMAYADVTGKVQLLAWEASTS